jgi:hypothetical protein
MTVKNNNKGKIIKLDINNNQPCNAESFRYLNLLKLSLKYYSLLKKQIR